MMKLKAILCFFIDITNIATIQMNVLDVVRKGKGKKHGDGSDH